MRTLETKHVLIAYGKICVERARKKRRGNKGTYRERLINLRTPHNNKAACYVIYKGNCFHKRSLYMYIGKEYVQKRAKRKGSSGLLCHLKAQENLTESLILVLQIVNVMDKSARSSQTTLQVSKNFIVIVVVSHVGYAFFVRWRWRWCPVVRRRRSYWAAAVAMATVVAISQRAFSVLPGQTAGGPKVSICLRKYHIRDKAWSTRFTKPV